MIKRIQSHINKLAKELNTIVVQGPKLHGMMYAEYEPPKIEGPLLDQPNCKHYPNIQCRILCLLHELGHVFHGHTQGRPPYTDKTYYFDNGVLRSEAEAWQYAIDRYESAQFPEFAFQTRHYMWYQCLGSYYNGYLRQGGKPYRLKNGNRHYVEFVYDKPDNFFWAIKDRMLNELEVAR